MTPLLDPVFPFWSGCLFLKNLYQLILGKEGYAIECIVQDTHVYI